MSRIRRIELLQPYTYTYYPSSSSVFLRETSIFAPKTPAFPSFLDELEDYELGFGLGLGLGLDLVSPSSLEIFDNVTDLIRVEQTPAFSTYRRIQRVERLAGEVFLERLSDRVTELESRFDRLARIGGGGGDRKYTWTAEIKAPAPEAKRVVDRKYKLTAEIRDEKKEKEQGTGRTYKWTAEIEGKGSDGSISKTYTLKASSGDGSECSELKKKKKKKSEKVDNSTRAVVIEEPADHGAVVLRQAFARRIGGSRKDKGKKKELSPQDAAIVIQLRFRAYLIHRSQALRALRDLAVAKTKLKEIRASFNNFSYRRLVARDAEERQRFSEKIIVLLLTVDAIEGADLMVRAAKRSMVDELEAMLDVVDPQPTKKLLSFRRRTFDMPDGVIQKEIAAGVAEVVQMLNHEDNTSNTFEACL